MNGVQAVDQLPGTLRAGGREFVILKPTTRDMLAVRRRMEAFAEAKCVPPLKYVLQFSDLPAAAMALAIAEAIKLGAGGGIKPHPDAVWEEYDSLEGIRWRVWYHVSRVLSDFTTEDAAGLVTDDNLFDVAESLNGALKLAALDPNAQPPANGTGS